MTRLSGSSARVVRIDLHDDRDLPIGELEVEVDPHGAHFPTPGMLAFMGQTDWLL